MCDACTGYLTKTMCAYGILNTEEFNLGCHTIAQKHIVHTEDYSKRHILPIAIAGEAQ